MGLFRTITPLFSLSFFSFRTRFRLGRIFRTEPQKRQKRKNRNKISPAQLERTGRRKRKENTFAVTNRLHSTHRHNHSVPDGKNSTVKFDSAPCFRMVVAGVCVCQCRVDTRKDETLGRRVNKNEFLFLLKLKASLAWAWHTTIRSTIPAALL